MAGKFIPIAGTNFHSCIRPRARLFLAPVSALGQTGLVIVLSLINAAAWFCCILFSVRLATGGRRRAQLLVYLIPSLAMGAHIWGNFLTGPTEPGSPRAHVSRLCFDSAQLPMAAGGLIAIAAAIKAFPVLAIVYLVYRGPGVRSRRWCLALTFLLIVLPIPFRGYAQAKQDLERWSSGMLFKYDETGVGQRLGRSTSWKNQSIWGVANRLLRHVDYDHKYEPHEPVYANFADLDFNTVNRIILGLRPRPRPRVFVLVMPRAALRTPESDAIEFALLLLLILIFTPLSFGYLFAWLLYPLTVVVQRLLARADSRAMLFGSAASAVALLALSIPFPGNGADLRERVIRNLAPLRRTGGRVGNGKARCAVNQVTAAS